MPAFRTAFIILILAVCPLSRPSEVPARRAPGARATRAGLRGHRQILLDVREAVQGQIERKATEDQAVANIDLPQYHRFQGYSRAMEMAVRRMYQELTTGLD